MGAGESGREAEGGKRHATVAQLWNHGRASPAAVTLSCYARARDEIENFARRMRVSPSSARPGVTRIPVVVHVVWNTAAQNISDAQINSQIDVLNHDFRRTNPDVAHPRGFPAVDSRREARVLPRRASRTAPPLTGSPATNGGDLVQLATTDEIAGDRRSRPVARDATSTCGSARSATTCSDSRNSPADRPRPTAS